MADKWQLKAVLSANAAGMLATLKSVDAASRNTRKYLSDVGKSAGALSGRVGLPFAALSAAVGGLSVAGVSRAVVGFTEFAEAIQKGSQVTGMSIEQFQRLRFAGEQANLSVEDLTTSMARFNVNVGNAAAGKNQDLAALFGRLGISLRDANGQVRNGADLLPEFADAFERNTNAAVRARMSMAAFGKSYTNMLPLLTEGGDSLRANLVEFDRLKGAIGKDEISAAENLGDEFAKLRLVFTAMGATVSKELVPVIRPLIVSLTDWWAVNRKLIAQQVGTVARDFGNWLKTIDFAAVLQGVTDFVKGMGDFVRWVGGSKNALIAFVAFINMGTIVALGSLGLSLIKAGYAFGVMLGPIGLAALALGALTYIIYDNWDAIKGWVAGITAAFVSLAVVISANPLGITLTALAIAAHLVYQNWDSLKSWFSSFFDWIGAKFQAVVAWAHELATTASGLLGMGGGSAGAAAVPAAAPGAAAVPAAAPGAALSALQSRSGGRVDGQININIEGAPAGTRVQQSGPRGIVPISVGVGYRSFATGAP